MEALPVSAANREEYVSDHHYGNDNTLCFSVQKLLQKDY